MSQPENRSPSSKLDQAWWIYALPLLACLLVMLPRLASPQFGLMDDGRSVITSQKLAQGVWDMRVDVQEGRSRPIYWLYFYLFYALFGKQPFWFFVGNTLVLLITTLSLMALVRGLGGSRLQTWWAGLLFALAGPVIENFYTLSKGEVPQIALLALSLLAMAAFRAASGKVRKLLLFTSMVVLLLAAHASKETSLVVLPISLGWWVLAWLGVRRTSVPIRWHVPATAAYAMANGLAAAAFLALRVSTVGPNFTGGSYTGRYAFGLDTMSASLVRWAGWLARDYAYAIPLVVFALLGLRTLRGRTGLPIQLSALVWMSAWVVVFFPWGLMAEYYMLPFALGLAVAAGGWIEQGWLLWQSGGRARWGAAVGFAFSAVLFLASLFNNSTTAQVQLAIDDTNAQMIAYITENAPSDSLIVLNIRAPNEYYVALGQWVNIIGKRQDVWVKALGYDANLPDTKNPYWLLVPSVKNQPVLTVRMGVVEKTQTIWNENLESVLSDQHLWKKQASFHRSFGLSNVDLLLWLCPVLHLDVYCSASRPMVDIQQFDYGWDVFEYQQP